MGVLLTLKPSCSFSTGPSSRSAMWSSVFSSLAVHAMAGVDCSLYGCERMVMHPARVCDEGHVVLCPSSLGNNSAALYYRISDAGRLRVSWSSHAFNAWLLRENLAHRGPPSK